DALLSVGFTQPPQSLWTLVRSYRSVSPLPRLHAAVYFLLHLPAGCPGLLLAITVLDKVRTFLGFCLPRQTEQFNRRVHPADSFQRLFYRTQVSNIIYAAQQGSIGPKFHIANRCQSQKHFLKHRCVAVECLADKRLNGIDV